MQNIAHDLEQKVRTTDVVLEENVSFTSLLLKNEIKKGLSASGFKTPSPIQYKAIPLGRCGFDLIVKSKAGTGKTLVFATLALEAVNVTKNYLQVLILAPTREIAVQIQDVIRNVGRFLNGLLVESFIGGTPLDEDIKKIKKCHIAVGAPGRIKHLVKLEALKANSVRLFVLDEADKLMEDAFHKDINDIYDALPERKQLISTSATYPKELDHFLANYMMSPTYVTSENKTPLLLGLKQFAVVLNADTINVVQQMKAKNDILIEIFSKVPYTQCLVFTNYQTRTESVCNFLNQRGYVSSFISAALHQSERLDAINNLKNFKSRILLSTDLVSRGIDVANVDLVINYDLPQDSVTYLHRMGRAGRYGSTGICLNFISDSLELIKLQNILGAIGASNLSIPKLPSLDGIDLWQVDPNNFEQISGKLPPESSSEINKNIKEEVFALKQHSKFNKNTKSKKRLEDIVTIDFIENKLKSKKELRCESSNVEGAEELFNSLLIKGNNSNDENDDDDNCRKRKRGEQNKKQYLGYLESQSIQNTIESYKNDIDNQSSHSTPLFPKTEEDSKKRKLNETTFYKNRALLSITKLICNMNIPIDEETIESVEDYLKTAKNFTHTFDNNQLSLEEILNVSGPTCKELKTQNDKILLKTDVDVIENIFKIGYTCSVKNTEITWLDWLPDEELRLFEDINQKEIMTCESEEKSDIYEDFNTEECSENSGEEKYAQVEEHTQVEEVANNATLEWVPVLNNSLEESNNDQFAKYFDDCSNVLWQTGLTFENVTEFDNWFYCWQEHLQSVRSYVQQNLYVSEMNKYQKNRLINK